MENLLQRADLAISESRSVRNQVDRDLAEARIAVALTRKLSRMARAQNDQARATLSASIDLAQK